MNFTSPESQAEEDRNFALHRITPPIMPTPNRIGAWAEASLEQQRPPKSEEELERERIRAWKLEHVGNEPRLRRIARVADQLMRMSEEDETTESPQPPALSTGMDIAVYEYEAPEGMMSLQEITNHYGVRSRHCTTYAFHELYNHGLLENAEGTGKYPGYEDGKRIAAKKVLRLSKSDQASVVALLIERGEIMPDGVSLSTRIDDVRKMVKDGANNPKAYAVYKEDGNVHYGVTTDKQAYDEWMAKLSDELPSTDEWLEYYEKVSATTGKQFTPYVLGNEHIPEVTEKSPLPWNVPHGARNYTSILK